MIENKPIKLRINNKEIQQRDPIKAERTLAVYISPSLNQEEQFEKIMDKINLAMYKLK